MRNVRTDLLFIAAFLLNSHDSNSLSHGQRSRREFVVDSAVSVAASSAIAGTSLPQLAVANEEIVTAPNQLALPPIGIGAWAWGDSIFWGYDKKVGGQFSIHGVMNATNIWCTVTSFLILMYLERQRTQGSVRVRGEEESSIFRHG